MRQLFLVWMLTFVALSTMGALAITSETNVTLKIYPSGLIVPRVEDFVSVTCRVQPLAALGEHDVAPVYELEWSLPAKTGDQLQLASHMNVTRHRNALSLHIMGIQKRDSGVYQCTATRHHQLTLVSNVTIAVVPKKGTCNKGFFACGTKEYCIANRFVCDGRVDCPDGADEALAKCGADPCADKIACEDGRCLDRNLCCELCRIEQLSLCCLQYMNTMLTQKQAATDDDYIGFLQSAVYAIIGCVVAFVFVVVITVVAVCRLHMKKAAMSSLAARLGDNPGQPFWTSYRERHQHQQESTRPCDSSTCILEVQQLPTAPINLLIACRLSAAGSDARSSADQMIHQLVGRVVEPPPYSESVQEPPSCDAPPPPYSLTCVSRA